MVSHRHTVLAAVALVILALEFSYWLFLYESSNVPLVSRSELAGDVCRANVTILGNFALTPDMPCTALFELTFGSLMTYLPELRPCPKIFVFEGMHQPGRKQIEQKRYEDFFKNMQQLGISNLETLQLPNQTNLIDSVRHGLSHVSTGLVFLWQPDLMLRRRPIDWTKIVQKLLRDDREPSRPDTMRDVHFGYHHEWDVALHGQRERFNYSGFEDDVYIIQYCDQLQLATTSFYRDHLFRLIDLKLQKIPPKEWGWAGLFMEGNQDVINANHSSVRYGSCYKAHCDKDKRKNADGYWDHWFYIQPSNLFSDIFHSFDRVRPCRQWNMQLCLPWAPAWFAPKALGCSYAERLALYGRLHVMLYLLLYGGLGILAAWGVSHVHLWRPLQLLLLGGVVLLPWGVVAFSWEYSHGRLCWNPPSFRC